MIKILARIALNGLAVVLAAQLVPGIHFSGDIPYLLLTGVVIGALNVFIKPLVTLLSLPLVVVTLGLFFIVINGALFYLAASLLSGLHIDGCMPAILGGLVLGLCNLLISAFSKK